MPAAARLPGPPMLLAPPPPPVVPPRVAPSPELFAAEALAVAMAALPFVAVLLLGAGMLPRVQAIAARTRLAVRAAWRAWRRPDAVEFLPDPPPAVPGPWPRFRHAEALDDTYHRFDHVSSLVLQLEMGAGLHCAVAIAFPGLTMSRRQRRHARARVWFVAAGPGASTWATTRGGAPPELVALDAPLVVLLEDRARVVAEAERAPRASSVRLVRLRDLHRLVEAGRAETCVQGRVVLFDATHQEALRELLWRVDHPDRRRRIPYPDRDDPGGADAVDTGGPPADARPRLVET